MKNANGSNSARTPKAKKAPATEAKPVDGAAPAAPPKPRGKKKAATAPADVPAWVKGAEAGPVAGDTTVTPAATEFEIAVDTAPKPPPPPIAADAPATLKAIADGWLSDMRARGKTPATVKSYEGDLAIAMKFFDASRVAGAITSEEIAAYETSEIVTKTKSGKGKAMPTVLKTRRALRLALAWAQKAGVIASLPYATAG